MNSWINANWYTGKRRKKIGKTNKRRNKEKEYIYIYIYMYVYTLKSMTSYMLKWYISTLVTFLVNLPLLLNITCKLKRILKTMTIGMCCCYKTLSEDLSLRHLIFRSVLCHLWLINFIGLLNPTYLDLNWLISPIGFKLNN